MKGQKYMGPTSDPLEVQGVRLRKPSNSAKSRRINVHAVAGYALDRLERTRQFLASTRAEKRARLARITAQRWEVMKPIVEHFAASPSTEVARTLLEIDRGYASAVTQETAEK